MRFRLMYLFSFLLSAVAMWFFKNDATAMRIVNGLSPILINLGIILSVCFMAMTVMGSGASLRRTRKYASTIAKSLGWTVAAGILALALGAVAGKLLISGSDFSASFAAVSLAQSHPLGDVSSFLDIFGIFTRAQYLYCAIFFAFILCLLFSYYLNPTLRVIQPAYALANSISEVGFKFFYTVCDIYIVFLFVISGAYFTKVFDSDSNLRMLVADSAGLVIRMGILCAVFCLVALPLLFALFTRFKSNPLPVVWSALITSLISVFSGNLLFSVPVMEEIHRHQNNSLKKTVSVSGNFMYLLSRSGSACVAYLAIVSLAGAFSPGSIALADQAMILGLCLAFSLCSGMFPGFEYLLVMAAVRILMPEAFSDDVMAYAVAYAPILGAFGLFMDTFAINFGAKACDIPVKIPSESQA